MWGILQKTLRNRKENARLPIEHRSLARLSRILSVTCRTTGAREPFMALTDMMDSDGMRCTVPLQLTEGSLVRVDMLLSPSLPVLRFNCTVQWCRTRNSNKVYDCAMNFTDITACDRRYLQTFIARYSIETPRSA